MVAFMVPLSLALGGWTRLDMAGIAIAAQNIAMVDVRGDYRLRLGLFLTMAAVYVGTISLGNAVGNNMAGGDCCDRPHRGRRRIVAPPE